MILLAVDTTAQVASAALLQNGALIAGRETDATKKHAETVLR
jgi:tRNA A37 threonylcarbamoyladenosine modification protein TsaB